MWAYLAFFFVAVVAKLLLAAIMIYLLLPTDSRCSHCDHETLWLRAGRRGWLAARLSGGRLQLRWCPRCGWRGWTRRAGPAPSVPASWAERARR